MNVRDDEIELFEPNEHPASELWYQLVAKQQAETLPQIEHEYPFTNDIQLDSGERHRIELRRKPSTEHQRIPEWDPVGAIDGVGGVANPVFWSGPKSGFVPLTAPRPLYFVDHGTAYYAHDAYGIHLGQEDHLTFVGPEDQQVVLHLADVRRGSPSFGVEETITFRPSALRYLRIPNGVAHAFDGLENIFTFNRADTFLPGHGPVEDTGNDVIDWPLSRRPFVPLDRHTVPADQGFYQKQVHEQRRAIESGETGSTTAAVFLTEDPEGRPVRVAMRRPTGVSAPAQHR